MQSSAISLAAGNGTGTNSQVTNNFIVGNGSGSLNAGNVTNNTIFGNGSGSANLRQRQRQHHLRRPLRHGNQNGFSNNTIFGDGSGHRNGANYQDNTVIGNLVR